MTRKSPPRALLAVEEKHPALDVAIVLAEDWAREVGGELILLVVPRNSDPPEAWRRQQAEVAKRVELVTGRTAGVKAVRWLEGRPSRVILSAAEAQRADRLVLALPPDARWSSVLGTSVLDDLLRTASQPILVARTTNQSGSVLVATDLAGQDEATLSCAAAEAARRGVCLSVLHCFAASTTFRTARTHPLDEDLADILVDPQLRVRKQGRERVAVIARREGVPTLDLVFAEGDVANTIMGTAERIRPELVVVGARRPAHRHLFRRGTAARIARLAPCPVLVVPEPAGAPKRRAGETPGTPYTAGQP